MITCVYSSIYNFLTIFLSILIINNSNLFSISFNTKRSFVYELFVNFLIKLLQFSIIFIIKYGVDNMKNILKKIAFNHTEKAFTFMQHYQPKLPKALKEKIEKNK